MGIQNEYENDCLFNNPNELDLFETKKSLPMTIKENENLFNQILPCVRRLYNVFDSIYPNIYQIHCYDSLRILNEIICLTNEYLHVSPSLTISTNELLSDEIHFENYIAELRRPSLIPRRPYPSIKTQLHCFGQGIDTYNYNNKLYQTLLFCFELTNKLSLPIDVIILDPDDNLVSVDIKYINTYNKGLTQLFSCSYTPITKPGTYKISFFYDNIKLPNSQYAVFVRSPSPQKTEQLVLEDVIEKPEQGKYYIFSFRVL